MALFPTGPVQHVSGTAIAVPGEDIDTDRIIPARFLKCVSFEALGDQVFADDRLELSGEHPFDQARYQGASILVVNGNFGCGSSREHAPWALLDFGIKCVIAPSFADIFYNNCFKNGILPIVLPQEDIDKLMDDAARGANAGLSIDLEAQEIRGPDGGVISFDVDAFRKTCLLEGLDDIALTLKQSDAISAYEAALDDQPWR